VAIKAQTLGQLRKQTGVPGLVGAVTQLALLQNALQGLLQPILGTDALAFLLRALGSTVADGVYIEQLPLGFELLTLEAGSAVAAGAWVSVMTEGMSGVDVLPVEVRPGAVIGRGAYIAAGAVLETGVAVGALSMVQKARLPAWHGHLPWRHLLVCRPVARHSFSLDPCC
jgi:hypothetical protein